MRRRMGRGDVPPAGKGHDALCTPRLLPPVSGGESEAQMRAGEFGRDRIPVVTHAMDIPERIRELDEGYFVMFHVKTQKFEVWHGDGGEGVLECVLPYDALDERAVRHIRQHRMERIEQLIREIEEHNARLEAETQKKWLDEAGDKTKEAFDYLRHKSDVHEIPTELLRAKGETNR